MIAYYIPEILFFLFSACLVGASLGVILSKNPIHAVLLLIVAFFNAAALFLLAGAEFLAMILVIVYVGAVAVLFLFVVMMLDINNEKSQKLTTAYMRVAAIVASIFAIELITVAITWWHFPKAEDHVAHPFSIGTTNTHALGEILYTHYFYIFQLAGFILLVAMIGAIVLCFAPTTKKIFRKQTPSQQLNHSKHSSLKLMSVDFRKGVKPWS
jgi:NADH-quinone oxidoreductase subunit J